MSLELERPLVVFDLETTGTQIGRDRIVQIALVRLMPSGSRTPWQTLVNPGIRIPPEATEVHGISDLDVADAPPLEEVAAELMPLLEGADLAGFNVLRFDLPFLAEELHRVGIAWDNSAQRVVDSLRIFHHFERRDLSAASRFYLQREHDNAHDAMADVLTTADVLLAQVARYAELPRSVAELGEFCGDRKRSPDAAGKLAYNDQGTVCLGFGKYRGWTIETIGRNDPGYMQWLFTKAELPGSTLAIMRGILATLQD